MGEKVFARGVLRRNTFCIIVLAVLCVLAACGNKSSGTNNHVHAFSMWETKTAATCIAQGTQARKCSTCGFEEYSQIPMQGHTLVTDNAVKETCTTDGKTEGSHCSVCKNTIAAQANIPATGHTSVVDAAVAATCTTDGKTEGSHCSVCNEVIVVQTKVAATGHTLLTNAAMKATCTTEGKTESIHCTTCQEVILASTTIPATGHTSVVDAAVKATCTTDGKTEGKHCSRCNTILVSQTTIPSSGHQYNNGEITTQASCNQSGTKKFTCLVNNCRHSYTESYSLPTYTATELYNLSVKYVGEITTYNKNGTALALGTGFVISSDGKIVTNYHVIEGAYSADITINNQKYTISSVLAYDATIDLAILKVNATGLTAATVCKNPVNVGTTVYAMGSSRGMTNTYSQGIITYANRIIDGVSYIQHDASITNGNSGGPLINIYGEVIGINTWGIADSQNLNFAVFTAELDNLVYGTPITLAELFKQNVEWISQRDFFYYDNNEAYVLLFQLTDEDKIPMSSSGKVDIRIVNNNGITVYSKTHSFSEKDFYYWSDGSNDSYDLYLATIYIDPADIAIGSCAEGKVYFVVYGDDYYFNEYALSTNELPVNALNVLRNHLFACGKYDSRYNWYEVKEVYPYATYDVSMYLTYDLEDDSIFTSMFFYDKNNVQVHMYLSLNNNGFGLYYSGSYSEKNESSSDYKELNETWGYIDPKTFTDQTVLTYEGYEGLPGQEAGLLSIYTASVADILNWLTEYLSNQSVGISIADFGFTAY